MSCLFEVIVSARWSFIIHWLCSYMLSRLSLEVYALPAFDVFGYLTWFNTKSIQIRSRNMGRVGGQQGHP